MIVVVVIVVVVIVVVGAHVCVDLRLFWNVVADFFLLSFHFRRR